MALLVAPNPCIVPAVPIKILSAALVAFKVTVVPCKFAAKVMLGVAPPATVSVNWNVVAEDACRLVAAESVTNTEPAALACTLPALVFMLWTDEPMDPPPVAVPVATINVGVDIEKVLRD